MRNIAKLENIFFHCKLDELRECKIRWNKPTSTLQHVYGTIAGTLIELHADELINEGIGRLSVQNLTKLQDLTEVPIAELVVEMIKMLARANPPLQSGVWLTFATLICPVADTRQSRIALERLLDSNAGQTRPQCSRWGVEERALSERRGYCDCVGTRMAHVRLSPAPKTGGEPPTVSERLLVLDTGT